MKTTYGTPLKLTIEITDILATTGRLFADITDVKFMLKSHASESDENADFSKSVGEKITLNGQNETIEVAFESNDYGVGKIRAKTYLMCLGVEFLSSGDYIEDYDPDKVWEITFTPDKIRDN